METQFMHIIINLLSNVGYPSVIIFCAYLVIKLQMKYSELANDLQTKYATKEEVKNIARQIENSLKEVKEEIKLNRNYFMEIMENIGELKGKL